jgi:TonB family protein
MKTLAMAVAGALMLASAHAEQHVSGISSSLAGVSSTSATAIARPLPQFPLSALHEGYRHGNVVLRYDVAVDGSIRDVVVLSAHPVQVFTRASVDAVRHWRYMPGAEDRRLVEFVYESD